jgi:type I restriction enzyme S subunit
MIEGLKPYLEYKESGQKWLGGVPAHWDLKPGHAAFAKRNESNCGMKEKTVLSLSYGRIKVKATDKQHGLVPESYETYQVVNEGNVIIRGTDLQNDHTSLRIGLSRNRGIISSAYLCLEAQPSITPEYGYQILNVFDLTKAIYRYGSGLRQNLDHGEIKRLPIFLAPLDEQSAIVRFLDHANRKIDGFIRAKRKLIGLLNEQKQAIIHRAVTRGLQPDVPLKPSGIPWLGDIPKHWEVRKIKSLVLTYGGMTPSKGEAEYWKGTIPWVSPKDMKVREIRDSRDHISNSALRQTGIALIQPPAVLIVVRGMILARTFPTAITAVPVTINQDMKALVPKPGLSPDYFVSLLTGIKADLLLLIEIAGHGTCCLRTDAWGSFMIPVPPLSEQNEIEHHLKDRLSIQNTAIARTEREIALMREYRTRLTADLVTGKLDVREAAARLPDPPVDAPAEPAAEETLDVFEETDDLEETPAED